MKMAKSSPIGYKTLWEKEKLLFTSNFSFSHSVFKGLVPQTRKNQSLFGKVLKHTNPSGSVMNRPCFEKETVLAYLYYALEHASRRIVMEM